MKKEPKLYIFTLWHIDLIDEETKNLEGSALLRQ